MNQTQQSFTDLREVVFQLEMNPCCQKGEPFQESLYVGILAFGGFEL